jgi:hypothetical protein
VHFIHPELRQLVLLRVNQQNAQILQYYYRAREEALCEGTSKPLHPFRRVTIQDLRLQVWPLDCHLDSILATWESLTKEERQQLDAAVGRVCRGQDGRHKLNGHGDGA